MPRAELSTLLVELQTELGRRENLTDGQRERLAVLHDDIETILAKSDEEPPEHQGLLDKLREAAQQFEQEHPTLTATLGRIVSSLEKLGI